MTVAEGKAVYTIGRPPCTGIGLEWSIQELEAAVYGPVASLVFDDEGREDINNFLSGLAETEFEQQGLGRILTVSLNVEDWRVGEAIAEAYLTDHRECFFPWPDGRDERKKGSSLPGADLVGFHADSQGDCFVFGEVKTSSDPQSPPNVVYGKSGLQKQLEDLRDNAEIRDTLVLYLGFRAKGSSWCDRFKDAYKRYINIEPDIKLFGFLVRDVTPDKNDLENRVIYLANNCPSGTNIELLTLYIPTGRISGIGNSVAQTRQENTQ